VINFCVPQWHGISPTDEKLLTAQGRGLFVCLFVCGSIILGVFFWNWKLVCTTVFTNCQQRLWFY